mmetsp:Transcript_33803/g.66931  ORF Transcript_33803/g.66931 Transcript_33803/m.66931 type:complete len:139 (+) Transcript_33803:130-546(+)
MLTPQTLNPMRTADHNALFDKPGTATATLLPSHYATTMNTSAKKYTLEIRKSRFPSVEPHPNKSGSVERSIPGYDGHVPSLYVDPLFQPITKENTVQKAIVGYTGHVEGLYCENVLGAPYKTTKELAKQAVTTRTLRG